MNRRCMNCMKIFMVPEGYEAENNCCPSCGFIENTPPENISYLPVGLTLNNRYYLGTVIGSGGFGITYRAWDKVFDCVVAIKEFFPRGIVSRSDNTTISVYSGEEIDFEHGKERFLKEARSLVKFNKNPNIVSVMDYFEANSTAYMVMEYLQGTNLRDYTKPTKGILDFKMVKDMAIVMCDVLKEVHAANMVHRDISPDNIFLNNDGTFTLIDFGASRFQATGTNLSTTIFLKHGYAPVEQYSKTGEIGPWTDIYALSATIYKLTTGVLPPDSIDRINDDKLVPLDKIATWVPKSFSNAVMKGLAVQVTDRFDNVNDFKSALLKKDVPKPPPTKTVNPPVEPIPPTMITPAYNGYNYKGLSIVLSVVSMIGIVLFTLFSGYYKDSGLTKIIASYPFVFIVLLFDAFAFFKDRNLKGFEIPIGIGSVLGCASLFVFAVMLKSVLSDNSKLSDSQINMYHMTGLIVGLVIMLLSFTAFYLVYKRSNNPRD